MKISSTLFGAFLLAKNAISQPVDGQDPVAKWVDAPLNSYDIPSSKGRSVNLFYADGFAYYGDSSAWTASVITNVTFSFSANPGALSTNAMTDGVTIPDNTLLYVIPNATSPQPIGFTGSKTTPSGAVTDRWTFYETYATYEDSTGKPYQNFFVKETDVKGVWQLYWANVTEVSGYTTITVRNHAPY